MFDAGLRTVVLKGDHFLIQLAHGRFTESSPFAHLLASRANQPLHFQARARLRTDPLISNGTEANIGSDFSCIDRATSLQVSRTLRHRVTRSEGFILIDRLIVTIS